MRTRSSRPATPLCRFGDGDIECFHAGDDPHKSLIAGGPTSVCLRWGEGGGADADGEGDEHASGAESARESSKKKGKRQASQQARGKHRLAGGPVNVRR